MLACTTHIPVPRIPAHVIVIRDGRRVAPQPQGGLFLEAGDQVRVSPARAFTFSYAGNRYRVSHGRLRLECRALPLGARRRAPKTTVLAVFLESGRIRVRSGATPSRALVLTQEMLAFAPVPKTHFVVGRNPSARST